MMVNDLEQASVFLILLVSLHLFGKLKAHIVRGRSQLVALSHDHHRLLGPERFLG